MEYVSIVVFFESGSLALTFGHSFVYGYFVSYCEGGEEINVEGFVCDYSSYLGG